MHATRPCLQYRETRFIWVKAKNDIGTADKCNYMCVAHQEAVVHGVAKKEKQGRNEDGSLVARKPYPPHPLSVCHHDDHRLNKADQQ